MSVPGSLACAGEWRNKGKVITISEKDGQLVLEMGPETPTLLLAALSEGAEVWPMQWKALRKEGGESKDPLYIVELSTPSSPRLLVKRPTGDGSVEFTRVEAAQAPQEERARSRSRLRSRSAKRSRSGSRGAQPDNFKPGDWACPKCSDHQFARNLACRSCGTAKPGSEGGGSAAAGEARGEEGLAMKIKRMQRESPAFKERWWAFCDKYGKGFYDPVRHDQKLLETFMSKESGGGRSRSGSSRSRSSPRRRTKRRVRRKREKSEKGGKRRRKKRVRRGGEKEKKHRHGRRRRKEGGGRRRRKRSRSSSARSGMPSREVAVKAAQRVVRETEADLKAAREAAESEVAEKVRQAETNAIDEVANRIEDGKRQIEEDFQRRLREAEDKLQEEKVARMREAEHKLDVAIESRLKEAEKRLRKDAEDKIAQARKRAEEGALDALSAAKKDSHADTATKISNLEEKVAKANATLAALKAEGGADQAAEPEGDEGSGSYSGSDESVSESL